MPKRVVEIDDTLKETLDSVKDEIKELAQQYMKDNPDTEWSDVHEMTSALDYNGGIHEIIDSSTPIYTKEINDLHYLYGDQFEEAYGNAGIGDGSEHNHRQVAIYCYLQEQSYDMAKEIFEEIEEAHEEEGGNEPE